MKIRILSPAQDEIHSIIRYYDDQAVGLGLDFIEELEEAWDLIREHPEIGARYHADIRCLFLRCPYCGESYMTAETMLEIERLRANREGLAEERQVGVVRCDAA